MVAPMYNLPAEYVKPGDDFDDKIIEQLKVLKEIDSILKKQPNEDEQLTDQIIGQAKKDCNVQ